MVIAMERIDKAITTETPNINSRFSNVLDIFRRSVDAFEILESIVPDSLTGVMPGFGIPPGRSDTRSPGISIDRFNSLMVGGFHHPGADQQRMPGIGKVQLTLRKLFGRQV